MDKKHRNLDINVLVPRKIVNNNEIKLYMLKNLFIITPFTSILKHRLFKSSIRDRGEIESYIKRYINSTASKYNTSSLKLNADEQNTKWILAEQFIKTEDNVEIAIIFIKSWVINENNSKWVIIIHGLKSHKYRAIIHGLVYLRMGYNIVVFDQRNHGDSSKTYTTMSHLEKYDVKTIVDHLLNQYQVSELNFHGWSMGAFTTLEYLKITNNQKLINFAVVDSPICHLSELYQFYLQNYSKADPYESYHAIRTDALTNGYDPDIINPAEGLESIKNIKMLFILNEQDKITPYDMGLNTYHNKVFYENPTQKSKLLSLECGHVKGLFDYYQAYIQAIENLINSKY